jgi:hypothetical protein
MKRKKINIQDIRTKIKNFLLEKLPVPKYVII